MQTRLNSAELQYPAASNDDHFRQSPYLPNQHTVAIPMPSNKAKYKSNIMEKYLRDQQPAAANQHDALFEVKNETMDGGIIGGGELSKWLESAANFQPDKNNYIEWEGGVR